MEINKISSNNNFNGLHIKVKDVEQLNKFVRPFEKQLREISQACEVYLKPSILNAEIEHDYMIYEQAIQVMVKPKLLSRLNPFSKLPKFLKTDISVNDLTKDKSGKRLLQTVEQAVEDLFSVKF